MNFEIVEDTIRNQMLELLNFIAEEYDKDSAELHRLMITKDLYCLYKFSRGKNKGQVCGKKSLDNGYCKAHQKHIVKIMATVSKTMEKKIVEKPAQLPKTKQQILEWLNTAVPQEITKLYRHELGLIHKETDIIFECEGEIFTAIGKADNGKLIDLDTFELDYCEKMGWRHCLN